MGEFGKKKGVTNLFPGNAKENEDSLWKNHGNARNV